MPGRRGIRIHKIFCFFSWFWSVYDHTPSVPFWSVGFSGKSKQNLGGKTKFYRVPDWKLAEKRWYKVLVQIVMSANSRGNLAQRMSFRPRYCWCNQIWTLLNPVGVGTLGFLIGPISSEIKLALIYNFISQWLSVSIYKMDIIILTSCWKVPSALWMRSTKKDPRINIIVILATIIIM